MKAAKAFATESWKNIMFTTPNLSELRTMSKLITSSSERQSSRSRSKPNNPEDSKTETLRNVDNIVAECITLSRPLMEHISTILVTLGRNGVLVCRDAPFDSPFIESGKLVGIEKGKSNGLVSAVHFPAYGSECAEVEVVSVTGAGDRYVG